MASASWHGRPIRDPLQHSGAVVATSADAHAVRFGAGYDTPGGSERVRSIQAMLRTLGYQPGPVDGLFGPRTRAAIQWFQIKHGFARTGAADAATLAYLRFRSTAAKGAAKAQAPNAPAPLRPVVSQPVTKQLARTPADLRKTGKPARGLLVALLLIVAVVAIGAGCAATVAALRRRGRRQGRSSARKAQRRGPSVPARPAPVPEPPQPRAVGYVRHADAGRHAAAIEQACSRRGWTLVAVARDRGKADRRPALAQALEQISSGAASRLVVARLDELARSRYDLASLLDWFAARRAGLVAVDVGLDTTTRDGAAAARALLPTTRIERWRGADRVRNRHQPSVRGTRRTSRPAVADRPELVQRIRAMRETGMTLQAIADTLNKEGVPTARGGAQWRPSSIQSTLGRRTHTSRSLARWARARIRNGIRKASHA